MVNSAVLCGQQLAGSADAEPWIRSADYKVVCSFSAAWAVSTPDPPHCSKVNPTNQEKDQEETL